MRAGNFGPVNTPKIRALRAPDGAFEVPVIGEVGSYFGQDLLNWLMMVKPEVVKFIVRSPGGLVFDVFDAIDYMNANGITSYTEVYGDCMSAATLFAAHSTPARTSVTQSSRFGIHKASGAIGDDTFVTHANDRLASAYGQAYGWTASKTEKYLTANDGTGTVWVGSEIVEAGIAGELLSELKVAANMRAYPNTVKMKVKAKLTQAWDTVKALATDGVVEVEVDVDAELKNAQDALAQATSDRQAAEAKVTELTDAEAAAQAKIAELTTAKESAETAKTEAEKQVAEVTAKMTDAAKQIETLTAQVKALEKNPAAPKVTANAEVSTQTPGQEPPAKQVVVDPIAARARSLAEKLEQQRAESAKKK